MVSLLKRDVYVYGWSVLFLFMLIPLGAGIQPETVFLAFTAAFATHLFYYDSKATANRYLVSLPIRKSTVIRSRYLSLIIMAVIVILLQWVVHLMFVYNESLFDAYIYRWQDIVVLLSFFLILSALAIPMYYVFHSFVVAAYVQLVLLLIGSYFFFYFLFEDMFEGGFYIDNKTVFLASWLENTFTFQPYILFPAIALVMYLLSMKLSEWLLARKVM